MSGYEFDPGTPPAAAPEPAVPTPVQEDAPPTVPPAVLRFQSCRWRQAPEDGVPEHCTHRDVGPMAGKNSFDPHAWCPDCEHYKVRRQPRKRPNPPPSDRYYY